MNKKTIHFLALIIVVILFLQPCFMTKASAWGRTFRCYSHSDRYNVCDPCCNYTMPVRNQCCTPYSQFVYYHGPKVALFNGKDLSGWTNVAGKTDSLKWEIKDGAIYQKGKAGDLYAIKKYENFILEFDFKISKNGNSGIKYKSWNTSGFGLGCEYQILDTINENNVPVKQRSGSLYDVIPTRLPQNILRSGEFNHGKIIVTGKHIEHWLNGQLAVSVEVGSPTWLDGVANSKFAQTPEFGTVKEGRIFLQDHNDEIWFKNIYITELKEVPQTGCF